MSEKSKSKEMVAEIPVELMVKVRSAKKLHGIKEAELLSEGIMRLYSSKNAIEDLGSLKIVLAEVGSANIQRFDADITSDIQEKMCELRQRFIKERKCRLFNRVIIIKALELSLDKYTDIPK